MHLMGLHWAHVWRFLETTGRSHFRPEMTLTRREEQPEQVDMDLQSEMFFQGEDGISSLTNKSFSTACLSSGFVCMHVYD